MDTKAKKRRELLGITSKRKMSLRKNIDNLKANECTSDITQVTKCVFLGALSLKPSPQLFDNPSKLEELDQTVFHASIAKQAYPESIQDTSGEFLESCTKRIYNKKRRTLEVPKTKRKRLLSQQASSLDIKDIKIEESIKLELFEESQRERTFPMRVKTPDSEPLRVESPVLILEPVPLSARDGFVEEPASTEPQELTELTTLQPESHNDQQHFIELTVVQPESAQNADKLIELTTLQPDSENQSTDAPAPEDVSLEEQSFEHNIIMKKEGTPELLLSDSEDDTIDQLMLNIMDIKIEHSVFSGREMYEGAQSDLEEYSENTNVAISGKTPRKKYIRRSPQCKICSKVFATYLELKLHKQEHDGDKPYLCLKCKENHETLDQLLAHLRTHQGKRPYVCKKCNQSFRSTKELEKHQPVHVLRKVIAPKKTFNCEVCKKEFHKLCDLERHTRVHTGEKPSVCNICNRRFQQAHNLNKHLLIHTQEKPFQCDICNKKFGRNDVLNRHLLTHSLKKPNHCDICMKSFIRVSQLMLHKEKHHVEKKKEEQPVTPQNELCI